MVPLLDTHVAEHAWQQQLQTPQLSLPGFLATSKLRPSGCSQPLARRDRTPANMPLAVRASGDMVTHH